MNIMFGDGIWARLITSVALLILLLLVRFMIGHALKRSVTFQGDLRRRWLVNTKMILLLIFLAGIFMIWGEQIQTFALSLVAVAVALAIAMKEMIMCMSGAFYRATTRVFTVGDRIEVGGVRGDVIDHNLFATSLLEIGPGQLSNQYTGRAIVLPNSLLLLSQVTNETFTHEYVLHLFTVPLRPYYDWKRAEEILLMAAKKHCAPFFADAQRHFQRLGQREGLDIPPIDPRVSVYLIEPERLNLVVRIAVPARRKGRIEQAIIRDLLDAMDLPPPPGVTPHPTKGET